MIQRCKDVRLANEARAALGVDRERVRQDFEGNLAPQFRVVSPVDLAHAAGAYERPNRVRTEWRSRR